MDAAPVRQVRGERGGLILAALVFLIAAVPSFRICSLLFAHFLAGGSFHQPEDLRCFLVHGAYVLGRVRDLPAGLGAFMNPPPLLLLSAPLSVLPAGVAFCLWSALGIALFAFAGWRLGLRPVVIAIALLLPPSIYCITLGQTGMILSGLLVLSLYWAQRRPVLSGIAAGLMVLKPPLALLLPICYIAARKPSAFLAAGCTAVAVCALSVLAFGLPPWLYFLQHSMPDARQILQAGWHLNYQNIMASPFILFRSFGVGLKLAYALQLCITLLAIVLTWLLWRRPGVPGPEVIFVTACLAALATPYDYIYDFPALGLLLLACWPVRGGRLAAALLFMLGTGFYVVISVIFAPIGALLTAALTIAFWPRLRPAG